MELSLTQDVAVIVGWPLLTLFWMGFLLDAKRMGRG